MAQITRKWIEDRAIDGSKLDSSASFIMDQLSVSSLGIGTTSPQDKLHIRSTFGDVGIRVQLADGINGRTYRMASNTAGQFVVVDGSLDQTRMVLDTVGKLGVGTTVPQTEVHVYRPIGDARVRLQSGAGVFANYQLVSDATRGSFAIYDVGTSQYRMTVDATGGVGIGTTVPKDDVHIYAPTGDAGLLLEAQTGTGQYEVVTKSDGYFYIRDAKAAADRVRVDGQGNVHISKDTTMAGGLQVGGTTTIINQQVVISDRLEVNGDGVPDSTVVAVRQLNGGATSRVMVIENAGTGPSLTIDSGKVGIGTTNPLYHLSIYNNVNSIDAAFLKNDSTGTGAYATVGVQNDGNKSLSLNSFSSGYSGSFGGIANANLGMLYGDNVNGMLIDQYAAAPLYLATANTVRVTITSSGSVGIGTTNPSDLLTVNGANSSVLIYGTGRTSTQHIFAVVDGASNQLFRVQNGGYVGVGTTNPDRKLHVSGSGATDSVVHIVNTTSAGDLLLGVDNASTISFIGSNTSSDLKIQTNALERIRVTSAGSVGIGTTNPGSTLDVEGSIQLQNGVTGVNWFDNDTALAANSDTRLSTQKAVKAYVDGAVGGVAFWSRSSGNLYPATISDNVGIGTTNPGERLELYNNGNTVSVKLTRDVTGNGYGAAMWSAWDAGTNDHLAFGLRSNSTSFSEKMRITVGGNVGIGVTNPSASLQVNGTIRTATLSGTAPTIDITQASVKQWQITNPASTTRLSIIEDGTTERVSIIAGGNVGIGVTNPGYSLQVKGEIISFALGSGIDGALSAATSAGTKTILLQSNGYSCLTGGNVGIGTNFPTANLDVRGALSLFGSTQGYTYIKEDQLNFRYDYNGSITGYINYHGYADGVGQFRDLSICDGKTNNILLVQGTSGNVGIGTNNPGGGISAKLHVYKPTGEAGILVDSGDSPAWLTLKAAGNTGWIKLNNGSPYWMEYHSPGAGSYHYFDHKIGILVAPLDTLDVNGNIINSTSAASLGTNTYRWGALYLSSTIDYKTNPLNITYNNGASTVMTLTTSSNVGIGITNPSTCKLAVVNSNPQNGMEVTNNYGSSSYALKATGYDGVWASATSASGNIYEGIGNGGQVFGVDYYGKLFTSSMAVQGNTSLAPPPGTPYNPYPLSASEFFINIAANPPTGVTISSVSGGQAGRLIMFVNSGAGNITIIHNAAAGADKILTTTSANLTVTPQQMALLVYDIVSSVWRAAKI